MSIILPLVLATILCVLISRSNFLISIEPSHLVVKFLHLEIRHLIRPSATFPLKGTARKKATGTVLRLKMSHKNRPHGSL